MPAELAFSQSEVRLGTDRSAMVSVRNTGGVAVGPVLLIAGSIRDVGGSSVPGANLVTTPSEIPTLNPGDEQTVALEVDLGTTLRPGPYDAQISATAGEGVRSLLILHFDVLPTGDVAGLRILGTESSPRTGDVVPLELEATDPSGAVLEGAAVMWTVEPVDAGFVSGSGSFVGYRAGVTTLIASAGDVADTLVLEVRDRGLSGAFSVVGEGIESERFSSDLWLYGDYAYTGTWGRRVDPQGGSNPGNTLNTWSIVNPQAPVKVSSLQVDARTVNDVKVRADGKLAVITHEGSNDGLNGVTFLDLSQPAAPRIVGRFSEQLQPGVHNAWIEGDYAYLVVDGRGSGLRILNISDPGAPRVVAKFYAGSSFLHDVYVRDGLAFLSHWDAGLIILDVGNGLVGGSPEDPVEVGRLSQFGGQTHNAWYWPERGYVFVGEEDFSTPGRMHVVDVRNLTQPREVATFAVPGDTPHNFWLDEDRAVLYMAWYSNGVRALDVSGELLGELDRQGREVAGAVYHGSGGNCPGPGVGTCTWAPQLHRGLVWVTDMNEGLVSLAPPF